MVANLPFAAGTAILRRLLGDPSVPLTQLDAIVEWGLAAKRTAVWPSTLLGCTWGAWYELSLVRRVPRACFAPPPSVDAAVLRADPARRSRSSRPRKRGRLRRAAAARVRSPRAPLDRILPRGLVHRVAHELGFDLHAAARDLDVRQWAAALRGGQICHAPPTSSGSSSPPRVTPLTVTSSGADHEVDVDLALVDPRQVGRVGDRDARRRRRARGGSPSSRRAAC